MLIFDFKEDFLHILLLYKMASSLKCLLWGINHKWLHIIWHLNIQFPDGGRLGRIRCGLGGGFVTGGCIWGFKRFIPFCFSILCFLFVAQNLSSELLPQIIPSFYELPLLCYHRYRKLTNEAALLFSTFSFFSVNLKCSVWICFYIHIL